MKKITIGFGILIIFLQMVHIMQVTAQETEVSVKMLVEDLKGKTKTNNRKELLKKLSTTETTTLEDVKALKSIILENTWDEELFAVTISSIKKIKKAELDLTLIEILKQQKKTAQEISKRSIFKKSDKEILYRNKNLEFIIQKLGELKSKHAIPALKEYLYIKDYKYAASEALAKIGDTTL